MTVELYPLDVPSGVEMLIAWLVPMGVEVGPDRPSGAVLPYRMVSVIPGADDKITDHSIYQVDDFATTYEAAEAQAKLTRRRILALGPPLAPQRRVQISTGLAYADEVKTSQGPRFLDFDDRPDIKRFTSRYAIDLRFVAV
jgi:hypothetical protein